MLTRTALITALSLCFATSAFAWSVPLSAANATADPGPHMAGDPIPCWVDNGWGETFEGTVATVDGELACTGMAVADDDAAIEEAALEPAADYTAVYSDDGSEVVLLEDGGEHDDLLKNLGGSNELKKMSGL